MAVKNQYFQIPFSGGVNPKLDPVQLQPPQVLQAQNMEYSSVGAVKRRAGLNQLPSLPANCHGAANIGATLDELLVTDTNGQVFSYAQGSAQWQLHGAVSPYTLANKKITSVAAGTLSVGGIRNLTFDHNGAGVGLMAFDNGDNVSLNNTLGTITLICFDTTTGKQFWQTTTTGAIPQSAGINYQLYGRAGASVTFSGSVQGCGHPCVMYNAASGNFLLAMISTQQASVATHDGSSTVLTGNIYPLIVWALPASALAANVPVIKSSGYANCFPATVAQSNYNMLATNVTALNHYFDMANTNTGGTVLVANAVSMSGVGTPYQTAVTLVMQFDPTGGAVDRTAQATSPLYNGAANTAAPISISMDQGNSSSIYGVAVSGLGYLVFTASNLTTFPSIGTAIQHPTASTYGWSGGPFAVGMYSGNVTATNGYSCEVFTQSGLTLTSSTQNPVRVNMASNQLIQPGGAGMTPIASKIFYIGSTNTGVDPVCWLYGLSPDLPAGSSLVNSGPFGVAYLARLLVNNATPVAQCLYLRSQPTRAGTSHPGSAVILNSMVSTPLMSIANVSDSIAELQLFSLIANAAPQITALPQGCIFTGAATKYYDGVILRGAGWPKVPELDYTPTTSTSGGFLPGAVTYTYYFVIADYDVNGNVLYSSPSLPYSVTTGSGNNNSVTFNIADLIPYTLSSLAVLYIYRNCSPSVDPLNYYRLTSINLLLGSTSYTDTGPDNLVGNVLLYSPPSGGELPNDAAPASSCSVATKSRCYVASTEVGSWLYYSKPFYYGRMPCEFNAAQFLDIDPSTGAIVGLGALDENVVIFKQNNIYLLTGTGPDATGTGTFNPPVALASDTGLQDFESLITTEDGIYFRSQRGIEILTRAYQVNYIGAPVEPLLYNQTVTNSIIVPTHNQVRFFLSSGVVLCYDYTTQAWTTYNYNAAGNTTVIDSTSFNGLATMLLGGSATPQVYTEPTLAVSSLPTTNGMDTYGYFIPTVLQTAHVAFPGPEGWGRIRRVNILGTALSVTVLNVTFIYDYGTSTKLIVVPITSTGLFNIRVRAPKQLCSTVSIQIADNPNGGNGQGCVISKLVLETSTKSGALRVPDSASY